MIVEFVELVSGKIYHRYKASKAKTAMEAFLTVLKRNDKYLRGCAFKAVKVDGKTIPMSRLETIPEFRPWIAFASFCQPKKIVCVTPGERRAKQKSKAKENNR